MAEENEVVAVFKAEVEEYNKSMQDAIASTEDLSKSQKTTQASTQKFEKTTKTASQSVSTLSRGLGGVVGLLGITGRLFGVNTEKLEGMIYASQQFIRVARNLKDAQNLSTVATRASTVAKVADEVATVNLTVAEKILNAVRTASLLGIGLVVAGVVALGTAIYAYVASLDEEEKALKRKAEIDKEQIKINGLLLESIVKRNEEEAKTILSAGVRTGLIKEQQAEEIALNDKFFKERIKIDKIIRAEELKAALSGNSQFSQEFIQDKARIAENRRKLEEEAEKTLQQGLTAVREKYLQQAQDEAKKNANEAEEARNASTMREFEAFIRHYDAIDKANREANKKILEEQKQFALDKQKLLEAQFEEEQDSAQKNRKIAQDEVIKQAKSGNKEYIQLLRDLGDLRTKEQTEALKEIDAKADADQIAKAKDLSEKLFSIQEQAFDRRQELRDEEITKQDENIERQRDLADKGLANTLAFEEKKSAELRREQQKDVEKQKKIKLLETFLNALASYSKTDPDTAIQKALLEIALAQGAMAIFAEEGGVIGEIGDRSTLSRKHKGGGDVLLHAQTGEGILPRDAMTAIGRRNFELLKNAGRHPIRDDIFGIPKLSYQGGSSAVSQGDVVKELKHLQEVVKNKKESHFEINKFGEYINTTIENGIRTHTHGKFKSKKIR